MSDKIILVSTPDDVSYDGVRMLFVDLTQSQSDIMSQSLLSLNNIPRIIAYTWQSGDDVDWVIEKSRKSNLIVFNAESNDQTLVGYFAGKTNAYYFGTLRSLSKVNSSVIFDTNQCSELFMDTIEKYGQSQR